MLVDLQELRAAEGNSGPLFRLEFCLLRLARASSRPQSRLLLSAQDLTIAFFPLVFLFRS